MTSKLLDNEMVMMNIDRGSYYGLEQAGSQIWEALAQPITVSDLIDRLMTHYPNTDRAVCTTDTIDFLNELVKEELIVVHAA